MSIARGSGGDGCATTVRRYGFDGLCVTVQRVILVVDEGRSVHDVVVSGDERSET
jgi:hypothetical protein